MMPVRSAGLLIYRSTTTGTEVLLVHPGGPFWAKKDEGAWSIPKGIVNVGEDDLAAAVRETREELGFAVDGDFRPIGEYRQSGSKVVFAWAVKTDAALDVSSIHSNEFLMEWPPRSGKMKSFPEVDRAEWFGLAQAAIKLVKGQRTMLTELAKQLALNAPA